LNHITGPASRCAVIARNGNRPAENDSHR
jgi:hypothetical protein